MGKIGRDDALDIARKHIGMLHHLEITDRWNDNQQIYDAGTLKDCWFVRVNASPFTTKVGGSYVLAISKKDGRILFSGMIGE